MKNSHAEFLRNHYLTFLEYDGDLLRYNADLGILLLKITLISLSLIKNLVFRGRLFSCMKADEARSSVLKVCTSFRNSF